MADHISRPLGATEQSWIRSIPGGTGITVLTLLLSKPLDPHLLQSILHNLHLSHPLLCSKLTPTTLTIPPSPSPHAQIQFHDHPTTSLILLRNPSIPPFQHLLEHELAQSHPWTDLSESDAFFCNHYTVEEGKKWVLAFRLHTSVCDRTSGVTLLRDLLRLVREVEVVSGDDEFNSAIEDLVPSGKANKPFWARGVDLIGYSLNSFRFSNLEFKDVVSPRSTGVVSLRLDRDDTDKVLASCKSRGIKLCGAISAAAIIAAHSSKHLPDHEWEKYGVTTLVDCRKELEPPLQTHNLGFYHSAVLNTHDIAGEAAELWDLARRCYTAFRNAKNSNKHFTDMNDLNYLMCKAIDNPGLTPSSSSRTSLIAVFEDPVVDDDSTNLQQEIGLEEYVGCSSVHGVGPSLAVFDTIRNGALDCSCVYPIPLHSRQQMQELIDHMKKILVDASD